MRMYSDRRSTRDSRVQETIYAGVCVCMCAEGSGGQVWAHVRRGSVAEAQRKFRPEKPSFSEETSRTESRVQTHTHIYMVAVEMRRGRDERTYLSLRPKRESNANPFVIPVTIRTRSRARARAPARVCVCAQYKV